MKARDKGHVEEIITHLRKVESDYRINLSEEIEWLRGLNLQESANEDLEKEIEQAALKFFPLPPCYNEEQRKSKDYADSWYRARDEQNGFKHGAFWCKRHFVNAACEWLRNHLSDYWYKEDKYFNISGCIYEFKDAMMKK